MGYRATPAHQLSSNLSFGASERMAGHFLPQKGTHGGCPLMRVRALSLKPEFLAGSDQRRGDVGVSHELHKTPVQLPGGLRLSLDQVPLLVRVRW